MDQLMQGSGIVSTRVSKALIGWQGDAVCLVLVIGTASGMGDARACCLNESLASLIALLLVNHNSLFVEVV